MRWFASFCGLTTALLRRLLLRLHKRRPRDAAISWPLPMIRSYKLLRPDHLERVEAKPAGGRAIMPHIVQFHGSDVTLNLQ